MSTWNGNQERVYEAIAKGARTVGEVEIATGLDPDTIGNHIRRLRDAGRIVRGHAPDHSHATHYEAVRDKCLLAQAWRGVARA